MNTKNVASVSKKNSTSKSIVREIEDSRQQITVLFTDIESSTKLWETQGDTQGRLMVDRHNRLLFPVINKYDGRIIKTIGDSIMATFKLPGNAVFAAIAMQQMLAQERKRDKSFPIKIRIGIHTGYGLVESDDVYGDVVNVAARVESEAQGNQILTSESVATLLNLDEYRLEKFGSFKPRGKNKVVKLFSSNWQETDSLIAGIKPANISTVLKKQRLEMFFYALMFFTFFVLLYQIYLRYFIADSENASLWMLNPMKIPKENPWLASGMGGVILGLVIYLYRLRFVSIKMLRFFKGLSTATVAWVIYLAGVNYSGFEMERYWQETLYSSNHLFVEVLEKQAPIRESASEEAKTVQMAYQGDLLLLNDIAELDTITWNRVLIGPQKYGWIERKVPPKMGVPERRVTYTDKYYFRYIDLYGFLIMLPFFFWGYFNFRLKPV